VLWQVGVIVSWPATLEGPASASIAVDGEGDEDDADDEDNADDGDDGGDEDDADGLAMKK